MEQVLIAEAPQTHSVIFLPTLQCFLFLFTNLVKVNYDFNVKQITNYFTDPVLPDTGRTFLFLLARPAMAFHGFGGFPIDKEKLLSFETMCNAGGI